MGPRVTGYEDIKYIKFSEAKFWWYFLVTTSEVLGHSLWSH
jgi:hypothetical protein